MASSELTVNHTFQGPVQETSLTWRVNSELLILTCSRERYSEWLGKASRLLTQSDAAAFKTPVGSSEDGMLYFDTLPLHLH